ncbi:Bgt-2939 [Blumeria graminis f. sp. tritici]|uniref:Bgt-2939 n=2 Tax=Blumeria graminis f. sp. tritici TaxID=62690 RepID=A0A061HGD4_BLUGR|nr:hypothetical protein BGT96224_2939 [Blumeria graminis f. sp. tritici 96224]VCU38857.1 Bgt-2939 [Blumeria graminis f. sp. tritici]
MSDEETLKDPIIEHSFSSSEPDTSHIISKKRKRKGVENVKKAAKKHKRKNLDEDEDIDVENNLNKAFARMDSQLLSDYLAQLTRRFEKDLSSLELEDNPAASIADSTNWDRPRNLENYPGFLEKFAENTTKLWSASKKQGAPHTIIIANSGLRAADVVRCLKRFPIKEAKIAKLFAKHIKIQEAAQFLQNNRTGIAVGTPQRLEDLIEKGVLKTSVVKRIVIDASHIDQKRRGILEMRETYAPLMTLLGRKEFRNKYEAESDKIHLLFY